MDDILGGSEMALERCEMCLEFVHSTSQVETVEGLLRCCPDCVALTAYQRDERGELVLRRP